MAMLLVSPVTRQMVVIVLVKQLKRSHFSQLKKEPNLLVDTYEEGHDLNYPHHKSWQEIKYPRIPDNDAAVVNHIPLSDITVGNTQPNEYLDTATFTV